jgi:hypothetical protein
MEHNQLFILVLLCYLNGDMLTTIVAFNIFYVHCCFHNISWDFVQHILLGPNFASYCEVLSTKVMSIIR